MKYKKLFKAVFVVAIMSALSGVATANQVIDKNNWQKAQGLVPESVLNWIKSGDLHISVGEIGYEPGEYCPGFTLKSMETNKGKYKLNEKFEIVDAKTGGDPGFIVGFPFPDVDVNDPNAGAKVMYNGYYVRNIQGGLKSEEAHMHFVNRNKRERYVGMNFSVIPLDGYLGNKNMDNPDNLENMVNIVVLEPYDMAGTAMMTWRYRDSQPDMLFGYIPAIRRVRRMTPAGRSDAMFGSDFSRDDGGYPLYDGKIAEFNLKLVGKKKMLVAYPGENILKMVENDLGEIRVDVGKAKVCDWAFENKNSDVAAWFNTAEVWVPRELYVIEAESKDPYYNYGKQIIYIDAKSYTGHWKEIWDRSGEYWKTGRNVWGAGATQDGSWKSMVAYYQWFLDEKNEHCTIIDYTVEGFKWVTNAQIPPDAFSLGGFAKMGK